MNEQVGFSGIPLNAADVDPVTVGSATGEEAELPTISGLSACVDLRAPRTVNSQGVPVDEVSIDANGDGLICSNGSGINRDNIPEQGEI